MAVPRVFGSGGMMQLFAICGAALVLAGCVLPNVPYNGTTRATFISEAGQSAFAVYVYPRTAPQDIVIEAALEKAHPFCAEAFNASKVEILSTQDGTLSVPTEWYIEGRCVRGAS